jgi:integrase
MAVQSALRRNKEGGPLMPGKADTKNLFKRGKVWWVHAMRKGERVVMSTGETDAEKARAFRDRELAPLRLADAKERAEAAFERVQTADQKLTRALEALPALPVRGAWQAFLASPERGDASETTLDGYLCQWNRFERWVEARRPGGELRAVTVKDAGDYAADLAAAGLSPGRFNKHVDFLKMVFRVLADPARLASNPWDKIRRKRPNTQGRRAFTPEELQAVLGKAAGELQTLLMIGAYSGLRLGDAVSLDWGAVDLANGTITARPEKTASRTGRLVAVPIHPTLRAALERVPQGSRRGPVLPEFAALRENHPAVIQHRLRRHFKACGIQTKAARSGAGVKSVSVAGFHALRHTIVSQLASKGVPLEVIRGLVGHGGEGMTRAYVHQNAEAARSAVVALPDVVGDARPCPEAAGRVRELLEGMTAETWRENRDRLLEILNREGLPALA